VLTRGGDAPRMSGGDIRTARQARQVLNLPETASVEELRRAFRAAVRKAHPDRGGDAESLRRVIDANRVLNDLHQARLHLSPATIATRAPASKPARPEPPRAWPLTIEVMDAVRGGEREVRLPDGRLGRLKLPPGLRAGDKLRLKTPTGPVLFRIGYSPGALEVRGHDVWMSIAVPPRLLEQGGQVEIDAPTGRKAVTLAMGAETLRLAGQGLPARGAHPQGDLLIRVAADPALAASRARDLLRRFTAAWAA
jgi:curved DNA-binding protein